MWRRLFFGLIFACLGTISTVAPVASAHRGSMTTSFIIGKVSAAYGESKPRLVHVEKTWTDSSPHEVMYFIQLAGSFHRRRVGAHYLYFSALAGRWYVWGVQGYDGHHHLRWTDAILRKH